MSASPRKSMQDSGASPSEGTETQVSFVAGLIEKLAKTHPFVVNPPEHLRSKFDLTWNTVLTSDGKDKSAIDIILALMEECGPGLKNGARSRKDGVTAFFDFNRKLAHVEAVEVIREVTGEVAALYEVDKTAYLDPRLVLSVHEALCSNVDNVCQCHKQLVDKELKLGDMLDKDSFDLFLFHCSKLIPSLDVKKDVILKEVKTLMPICEDRNRFFHGASLQNAGNIEETAPEPTSYPNFRIILWIMVSCMEVSAAIMDKAMEMVRGPKHAVMEDVMKDKENDYVAQVTTVFEEVHTHALQYDMDAWIRALSDKNMVTSTDKVAETDLSN
ncbi:hypothetical protein FPOA_11649 [Fusarium poae]|uniref:Uncharacterized protein n=1 Tax=Fusarium poae TaxID=36050 RepID=A0A1B8AI20_FUSPO|nr:hypothetical protein FPOA_11649 [Fusarium poae]